LFKAQSICDDINEPKRSHPKQHDEHKDNKTIEEDQKKEGGRYFKAAMKAYNKCVDKPKEYKILDRPSRDVKFTP